MSLEKLNKLEELSKNESEHKEWDLTSSTIESILYMLKLSQN